MKNTTPMPVTYRLRVGTDYGPVQITTGLTKTELRTRLENWLKDEHSLTVHVEPEVTADAFA